MRIVVLDENLPRCIGIIFVRHGFEVYDVRDHGLRGVDDSAVFLFAKIKGAAVVTSDIVFANTTHHSPENHFGFFLIRLPSTLSLIVRGKEIDRALAQLEEQELNNRLIVISAGSTRIHNKHKDGYR